VIFKLELDIHLQIRNWTRKLIKNRILWNHSSSQCKM